MNFPGGSMITNSPATGDAGSVPGSGRSLGEGISNPLQSQRQRRLTDYSTRVTKALDTI